MSDDYTIAAGQAIALCWIARQPGLPPIHTLRAAVAQLHAERCGWCDYPLPHLIALLDEVDHSHDKAWWAASSDRRRAAIRAAQA